MIHYGTPTIARRVGNAFHEMANQISDEKRRSEIDKILAIIRRYFRFTYISIDVGVAQKYVDDATPVDEYLVVGYEGYDLTGCLDGTLYWRFFSCKGLSEHFRKLAKCLHDDEPSNLNDVAEYLTQEFENLLWIEVDQGIVYGYPDFKVPIVLEWSANDCEVLAQAFDTLDTLMSKANELNKRKMELCAI